MKRALLWLTVVFLLCAAIPAPRALGVLAISQAADGKTQKYYETMSTEDLLTHYEMIGDILRSKGWYSFVELRKGDKGEDVSALQNRLTELNYYTKTVNGKYDDNTVSAMKAYEKANGHKQDGIASIEEQTEIFGSNAVAKVTPTPKPTPTPRVTPTPKPTATPFAEPKYPLATYMYWDYSIRSNGTPSVTIRVKNESKTKTVSAFSVVYYCKDVYGDVIMPGKKSQYMEATYDVEVKPGRTHDTRKVVLTGCKNVKYVYWAITKILLKDGTIIEIPEREWSFHYGTIE